MKSRILFLYLLVFVTFFSCKTKQAAQKEAPKKQEEVRPSSHPAEEKPVEKPKISKQIKIALLIPLYLEQNFAIDTSDTEIDIEPRSLPALSFYEGAKLAVDSLSKSGIQVTLDVFDAANDSSAKKAIVLKYQTLKNYDLVFATFTSSQTNLAADEAKLLGIKMVLTQFGNTAALKNNPNVVLASPSNITQCKLMADYMAAQYHYSNFMVLVRKIKKENDLADVLKNETDSLLLNHFKSETKTTTVYHNDSISKGLLSYLSSDKRNILYLPSSDESYVSSVLNAIDTLKQKITVVGLPTWENFETVQFGNFLNLEIYLFSNSFLDYQDAETKYFRKIFIEKYNNDPLFSAYQGFSLTHYFSKLYHLHDKNFMDHIQDDEHHSFFKFVQNEKGNGYENILNSILKYSDYQLIKVNK